MSELIEAQTTAPPAVTPSELLRIAVDKGADLERLEKLMDLQERWQSAEAKRAFDRAMADFKANPPSLVKSKSVNFGKGGTAYKHAELDRITQKLAPALARFGLAHSWSVEQQDARIFVTCRLAHRDGHAETVTLQAPPDTSGSKNNIQAVGSTITYLSRYSLLAVTGLATGTEDNDGAPPEDAGGRFIEAEQQEKLEAMIDEVGADRDAFLAWLGVPALAGLPKEKYSGAVRALEKRRGKTAAKEGTLV